MEKICIVRRRKRNIQGVGPGVNYISDKEMMPNQGLGLVLSQAVKSDICADERGKAPVDEVAVDKNEMISFNLTPEQCELIRSGNFAEYLSSGLSIGTALNVQKEKDGQISLNFHFARANALRMLQIKHVCEMLQISRSFLGKLVKTKRLKSYKIGGLRRFALEDILEFLTRNECLETPEYKVL
ncbi:MAG: helix-turn-helix domain-containing protein [Syntrophales bacterium]|jgi:excisionase family DNA binding protein|nr:helix-turn-helix domain-containing protein [Syntrophales bacterium]